MGPGGYARTPIEEISPVSFDLNKVRRKSALTELIVIDFSGSMAAMVDGSVMKIDLTEWRQIFVEGSEAHDWLEDLISGHIDDGPNRSLLLTPTGRIRPDFHVWGTARGTAATEHALHALAAVFTQPSAAPDSPEEVMS